MPRVRSSRPITSPQPTGRVGKARHRPAQRHKGRTFSYIAEEIDVCRDVIERELRTRGIDTSPLKSDRRGRRGQGFWRCFDA